MRPPAEGHEYHWDTQLPSFGIRITAKGRKAWVCLYRVNGKAIWETIGSTAVIPKIADARKFARDAMTKARAGVNPIEERRAAAAAAKAQAEAEAFTFAKLSDRF